MASLNLNKVILAGHLAADPEMRQTQSGIPVCSFRVGVSRRYQPKTSEGQSQSVADFITVVAWRQQAEFVSRYFRKGSSICVVGSLQTRTWTDQSGQKRYATEVVADEANFVDSKSDSSATAAAPYAAPYAAPAAQPAAPEQIGFNVPTAQRFEETGNDDDLPF
jgi:single-strand DNA-binding protein